MSGPVTGRPEPAAGDRGAPDGVPRWFRRRVWYVLAAVAGALAAWWLIRQAAGLLILLLVSLLLSFALEPAVNWLSARGLRRGAATGLVMVAGAVGGIVRVGAMVPLIVSEAQALVAELPAWIASATPGPRAGWASSWPPRRP